MFGLDLRFPGCPADGQEPPLPVLSSGASADFVKSL